MDCSWGLVQIFAHAILTGQVCSC